MARLWVCTTLANASSGTGVEVGYPSVEQSAIVSPTAPTCVPQDHLERVLLSHLRTYPHARVELGTEVVDIAVDTPIDTGWVGLTVRDSATGAQRVMRARFVIAA